MNQARSKMATSAEAGFHTVIRWVICTRPHQNETAHPLYDLCAQKPLFRDCTGATNVANVYSSREQCVCLCACVRACVCVCVCVCVCTKTKTVIICFLMSLHLYMPQLAALVIAEVSVCLGDVYPILNSMYLGRRGRNSASRC